MKRWILAFTIQFQFNYIMLVLLETLMNLVAKFLPKSDEFCLMVKKVNHYEDEGGFNVNVDCCISIKCIALSWNSNILFTNNVICLYIEWINTYFWEHKLSKHPYSCQCVILSMMQSVMIIMSVCNIVNVAKYHEHLVDSTCVSRS